MSYYGGDGRGSVFDTFSLSPMPYPVLIIIGVASVFLVTSWYWSFEEAAESAGEQMNIALLLIPLLLILLVRWLSSLDNPDAFLGFFSTNRRRTHYQGGGAQDGGGSSPWGVAAVIVLLLVLLQYQSGFLEMWFPFA